MMLKNILRRVCGLSLIALCFSATAAPADKSDEAEVHLYLTRHGKTMLNVSDRVQGWSDAVLTPEGIAVAQDLGRGLKDTRFAAVYSSDSGRAMETARVVQQFSGQTQLPLQIDSRLREFNFGSYEADLNSTLWDDAARFDGLPMEAWLKQFTPKRFSNTVAAMDRQRGTTHGKTWPAEDYATISKRLIGGLTDIASQQARKGGGKVLVVSHGLAIAAVVDALAPGNNYPLHKPLANASITEVVYRGGRFEVLTFNELKYVKAGQAAAKGTP
ncbi:histidine phosphatase family protein [Curvibacter gracilis]|uniref:histidine phosphatase family protein n=1 Tax=Curvibacter gracilis TaxID=230310 RepID=UPI0004B18577|nr:histidine phosphatase family protein [Curvibacter gracilis]